jgi:AraC-like DNA-binding protein
VEELSKIVGLSRTHLYRKIREITNQSPVEFIRNLRLEKAARLLKENKFYVSEVAYMSGFTEMSYFRKIFKEFYGMTPSDYASGVGPSTEITEPREN